jgi:hypothetical protein
MTFRTLQRPPVTAEQIDQLKFECRKGGAIIRVKKLDGSQRGCIRIVLVSGTREAVRAALVAMEGATSFGRPFAHPDWHFAWNGPSEVNACFPYGLKAAA